MNDLITDAKDERLDNPLLLDRARLYRDSLRAALEVIEDKRRLTRELDVAMHGEEGAAIQASLCDLIRPAGRLRAEAARLREAVEWACEQPCAEWVGEDEEKDDWTEFKEQLRRRAYDGPNE